MRRELARLREAGAGELPVSHGERLSLHPSVALRQAEAPPVMPAPMAPRPPVPAAAAQPAAWRGPALLPFVGREDELNQLADAWQEGLALDLATDVGDFTLADRWVASPPEAALMDTQFRTKQAFNLVHLALARGDLCAAAAELLALGDVAALPQPYDRSHAGLRHAELCLACGDASGALVWLDRGQAEAAPIEARALLQAARVSALRRLQGDGHADTGQARADAQALSAGPAAVPAVAALAMRQACGVDQRDAVLRLAISLADRPAARASFVARWAAAAWQR